MKLDIRLDKPLHSILPQEWRNHLDKNLDYAPFRNLAHFKTYVSGITQRDDHECGISYKEALSDLLTEKPLYDKQQVENIRDLVRQNLLKRGLITDDIYERYKSSVEGVVIDIGELAAGNSECCLTPKYNYKAHFYELYINISYPYITSNQTITENSIRLLATIEELERQNINIKITLVLGSRNVSYDKTLFTTIPLFSHRDFKSIETMSAVLNNRLLRKFYFACFEDIYAENLSDDYGHTINLPKTINLGHQIDEIALWNEVQKECI